MSIFPITFTQIRLTIYETAEPTPPRWIRSETSTNFPESTRNSTTCSSSSPLWSLLSTVLIWACPNSFPLLPSLSTLSSRCILLWIPLKLECSLLSEISRRLSSNLPLRLLLPLDSPTKQGSSIVSLGMQLLKRGSVVSETQYFLSLCLGAKQCGFQIQGLARLLCINLW